MNKKLYKLMNWANIEEIIYSECDHPQDLLGPHPCTGGTLVQAFFPGASEVAVKWVPSVPLAEETALTMEEADEEGYFAVIIPEKKVTHYTFAVTYEEVGKGKKINRKTVSVGDPYRHSQVLENKEIDDLLTGNSIKSYKYMGAHLMEHEGEKGCLFTVWAPNALRVSVVGEFNDWDGRAHQMKKLNGGIYELFIPGKLEGQKYQFEIKLKGDITFKKNDPYSFEVMDNASVITKEEKYNWKDSDFLFNKKQLDNPIVYELNNLSISAKEVKAKGYNCVLINPIVPESKITDYFYMLGGTKLSVKELKEIIDEYHSEGIYVIFNYSISGFGRDKKGMSQFDGSCLFEHMDSRQGLSADAKMALFQYARPEVISYLESNVFYMLKELHADGLSISNVAQMMYLDYGKLDGAWVANCFGGNENIDAINLIKKIISDVKKEDSTFIFMAEDSSTHTGMTTSIDNDGLGFDVKWNEGFLGEYFDYMSYDPIERKYHHNQLVDELVYSFAEKFIIPFSALLLPQNNNIYDIFPGNDELKKSSLRLSLAYSYMHPGYKFVNETIDKLEPQLVKCLNNLYSNEPALNLTQLEPKSFEWLSNLNAEGCYISFIRKTDDPEDMLIALANFAGCEQTITTGVPYEGKYKELINTDDEVFGGSGKINKNVKKAIDIQADGRAQSISVTLAPLSMTIFKFIPYTEKELAKVIEERIRRNTPIKKSKKA